MVNPSTSRNLTLWCSSVGSRVERYFEAAAVTIEGGERYSTFGPAMRLTPSTTSLKSSRSSETLWSGRHRRMESTNVQSVQQSRPLIGSSHWKTFYETQRFEECRRRPQKIRMFAKCLQIALFGKDVRSFSSLSTRGSGWVRVGFADFKSVGPGPSVGAVGSTPSRSRQLFVAGNWWSSGFLCCSFYP